MNENNEQSRIVPIPPRWKGAQSSEPIYQFNERCFDVLVDAATSRAAETTLAILIELRELWAGLGPEARSRLAKMPFVVVEAHFGDERWWRRTAESKERATDAQRTQNGLPPDLADHLMHETLMFAWQMARWDATVALMSFGMPPSVTPVIAALTPHQIRAIATRESGSLQIRWSGNVPFWRDLLIAAQAAKHEKLAALHLEAKLLLCGHVISDRIPDTRLE